MKTAEEYISEFKPNSEYPSYYHEANIIDMINNAIKGTIKECAELCSETEDRRGEHSTEILNLIKEIK